MSGLSPLRRIRSDRLLLMCWEPGCAPLLERDPEIGSWVRTDRGGRGIATEAAALLTQPGRGLSGIDRIVIRCDPDPTASGALPRRLGDRLREVLGPEGGRRSSAERNTMVFQLSARQFRAVAASDASGSPGLAPRTSRGGAGEDEEP